MSEPMLDKRVKIRFERILIACAEIGGRSMGYAQRPVKVSTKTDRANKGSTFEIISKYEYNLNFSGVVVFDVFPTRFDFISWLTDKTEKFIEIETPDGIFIKTSQFFGICESYVERDEGFHRYSIGVRATRDVVEKYEAVDALAQFTCEGGQAYTLDIIGGNAIFYAENALQGQSFASSNPNTVYVIGLTFNELDLRNGTITSFELLTFLNKNSFFIWKLAGNPIVLEENFGAFISQIETFHDGTQTNQQLLSESYVIQQADRDNVLLLDAKLPNDIVFADITLE